MRISISFERLFLNWVTACIARRAREDAGGQGPPRGEAGGRRAPLLGLTVSGLFLSVSSVLSKHWVRMGFSESHIACKGSKQNHGRWHLSGGGLWDGATFGQSASPGSPP